ncbi:hypothetical protein [Spirosoma sp. KUDC1026]|uniref:hypothetical protein n=1 Tax=Spirosoma sp. KUDC1026 TaxID=2745947 RepID=UPI00159BB98C|nr:hypothetical protein [Spirosoma sp. KUDC1026]QKZ13175.1 hypothetical protein HU175_11225 [Spirosoma sp. KUDC1026]
MLTLSATRQTPYPYLQIFSFFGYTAVTILLSNLTTLIVFGKLGQYFFCYKALVCAAHPFVNREETILGSLLFIGFRLGLVWLLTRFVGSRTTVINSLLRESIFGLYLADLVYVLAFPISLLIGKDIVDWYYGSSTDTFRLAYTAHINPVVTFLLTGLFCLWLHSRADRFSPASFLLRFILCSVSLCLYIAWIELIRIPG